jgi:hypothetical protein
MKYREKGLENKIEKSYSSSLHLYAKLEVGLKIIAPEKDSR